MQYSIVIRISLSYLPTIQFVIKRSSISQISIISCSDKTQNTISLPELSRYSLLESMFRYKIVKISFPGVILYCNFCLLRFIDNTWRYLFTWAKSTTTHQLLCYVKLFSYLLRAFVALMGFFGNSFLFTYNTTENYPSNLTGTRRHNNIIHESSRGEWIYS